MANIEERIAELEKKLKEEKAKLQKIEARKRAALNKKERADDTRKKVLVGAVVMAHMRNNENMRGRIMSMLNESLTRDADRALFGLPALPKNPEN